MIKQLYPYYVVTEAEDFADASFTGSLTESDTMKPAERETSFSIVSSSDRLKLCIRCRDFDIGSESVLLRFDPDHSGRRPHNLVQIAMDGDGRIRAEKMEFDLVHLTPVGGVSGMVTVEDDVWEGTVELPLALVYPAAARSRRYIGFNLIRTKRGSRSSSKWSGLPGEISVSCLQGIGDLIFAAGLNVEQLNALIETAVADSTVYYTRWEKQKLPPEILGDLRSKKSGFSLRLKKEDAERASLHARTTEWGAKIAKHIVDIAEFWAAKPDDELFHFILPGNPRAMTPSQFYGDPLTGGNRETLKTCLETPFHFYNEKTGEWWYPGKRVTNPTTGEELVVEDNGEGWLIPEGFPNAYTRLMLVAAYRDYRFGIVMGAPYCPTITDRSVVPESTGLRYTGGIAHLAYAYILTGEIRYAYKAAILIGRIAEIYPYMNGGYHDGSYSDTVHISEPSTTGTEWKKNLLEAYDLIFDGIDQFHDRLQALFARKPGPDLLERQEPFDLRRAVEREMMPYVLYTCELERGGAPDWSMRLLELELEAAALIQNGELLHRLLLDSKFSLFAKLQNSYYRDGKYAYDSSMYVEGMSASMMNYPNWSYLFEDGEYFPEPFNLFEDARFGVKEIISFYYRYRCGSLSASFGDITVDNRLPISEERRRGLIPFLPLSETVFRRMPSARDIIGPALAQYDDEELAEQRIKACAASGRGTIHTLLLLAGALSHEDLAPYRVQAAAAQPPFLLQDSEVSVLRTGTNAADTKHLVLYGQPTLPHAHGDKLGLWIGAYGVHMLAHGGHYPFIWIGPKISQWELHSASCNVVLIDGRNQSPSSSIQLQHYEGVSLQVAGLESKEAYPGSHYERWSWLIQAPDGVNAYALDQFFVSNGRSFDYNLHGLDVQLDQIDIQGAGEWIPLEGTLAGANIPLYSQPGYGWMKAVKKAKLANDISWTFPYGDCGLKVTVLHNESRELICCLGEKGSQEMKKAEWDSYLLVRDENGNAEQHAASFVSVFEPYRVAPFLQSVKAMERIDGGETSPFAPTGICVTYPDGYRDILIAARVPGKPVSFRDEYGVVHTTDAEAMLARYRGVRLMRLESIGYSVAATGGYEERQANPAWQGTVEQVDADQRWITVRIAGDLPAEEELRDRVGFIHDRNHYKKPSPYYLREPRVIGNSVIFRTDISLFRGEAGWNGPEKARVQAGKEQLSLMGKNMLVDVKPGDLFNLKKRMVKSFEMK